MDDQADVGFVDPHAEGDGGNDDLHLVADEGLLVFFAVEVGEAGVVRKGPKPFCLKHGGGVVDAFAAGAVDNGGLSGVAVEERNKLGIDILLEADIVEEVGAVEGGPDDEGVAQGQVVENLLLYPVGRRCGEGGNRGAWEKGDEVGEREVVGAEVVPPFGDAVCFVDDGHAERYPAEGFAELAEDEAFGRDVEEVEAAGEEVTHHLVAFVGALGAVEKGGTDAVGAGAVDLVFHEGYERTDDHAGAGEQECRELVAE